MANLLKVHGSENQFFILDQTTLHQKLNDNELKQLAQTIADPKNNVLNGADGLLVVDSSNHPGALGKMRVFNADGSEASMCGNGLRTVSRYLAQKFNQTHFKVETNDADLDVQREVDIAEGVPAFSVQISPISFDGKSLPLENLQTPLIDQPVADFISGLEYSAVAVPNPHLISFMGMDQVKSDDLVHLGTMLNKKNPYFTDGVNVSFANVMDENELFVRTFERGVGLTNACGTGMTATSLIYEILTHDGDFDELVNVYNPGGMVRTHIKRIGDQYELHLIGNATFTNKLTISEDDLHNSNLNQIQISDTGEERDYQNFVKQLQTN